MQALSRRDDGGAAGLAAAPPAGSTLCLKEVACFRRVYFSCCANTVTQRLPWGRLLPSPADLPRTEQL